MASPTEPPQITGITNPFMAAVEPAAQLASAQGDAAPATDSPPPEAHTGPAPVVHSLDSPAAPHSDLPAPPPLDLSTRPSVKPHLGVDEASFITQAPSSPRPDLPEHPPVATPPEAHIRAQEDAQINPQVATLQAMFPDIDLAILQLVLEESEMDTDRAIESLLAMSDPSYQPQVQARPQPSALELDEQLAQRLQLEEDQAQQRAAPNQYRQAPQPPTGQPNVPYQGQYQQQSAPAQVQMQAPGNDIGQTFKNILSGASQRIQGVARPAGANAAQASQGQSGEGQGPDFRQQWMEVAETGKRSFNTIMSRAKAKIQEFSANQQNPPQPDGQYSVYPAQQQNQYQGAHPGYGNPVNMAPTPNPPLSQPAVDVQGYNINTTNVTSAPRSTTPDETRKLNTAPLMPTRSSFDTPDGSRASFDTSRLGLKPKKPVSLIGTQPAQDGSSNKGKSRAVQVEDEEDDLEYITSPFEERR